MKQRYSLNGDATFLLSSVNVYLATSDCFTCSRVGAFV